MGYRYRTLQSLGQNCKWAALFPTRKVTHVGQTEGEAAGRMSTSRTAPALLTGAHTRGTSVANCCTASALTKPSTLKVGPSPRISEKTETMLSTTSCARQSARGSTAGGEKEGCTLP